MSNLSQSFQKIKPFKALVLGDFLLDTYTIGKVKRISPEAPVPVLEVSRSESRPGGAGNVVLNLQALGAEVFCVGRVGNDSNGDLLRELLQGETLNLDLLCGETGYITAVKNRLVADGQQLVRIDCEKITPLASDLEEKIIKQLEVLISQVHVVAISDYAKGFLTDRLLAEVMRIAKKTKIPVVVDPKGTNFTKYSGATILKPNLSEAYASVKYPAGSCLDSVAKEIFQATSVDLLLITRSEAGMSLYYPNGQRLDFPVVSKEVIDVTGAGDTVLAVLCMCIANNLDLSTSVQFSNIAAGIAIERLGCVQVNLFDLAQRLLKFDQPSKIFDETDLFTKLKIIQQKKYRLLQVTNEQSLNLNLFKHIRSSSTKSEGPLIVYVEGGSVEDELVQFMAALDEVDSIVLHPETLRYLYQRSLPQSVSIFEGDLVKQIQPEEIASYRDV